jgi:hypothetical protein
VAPATIPINQSESLPIYIGNRSTYGLFIPSGWNSAAPITFIGAPLLAGPWSPVFDHLGIEAVVLGANVIVNRAMSLDALASFLAPWPYLKVRSGLAQSPVIQTAERLLILTAK